MTHYIRVSRQLTYEGAAVAIAAAVAKAREIGVPQNVSAQHSSFSKAQTAASLGDPTGHLPGQFGLEPALATGGRSINMVGGLPIILDGDLLVRSASARVQTTKICAWLKPREMRFSTP